MLIHVNDAPSFSLVFIQLKSSNIYLIFYFDDIGWAEHISKKLYDPLVMIKVIIEKLKRDISSSFKAHVDKTPNREVKNFLPQFLYFLYLRLYLRSTFIFFICKLDSII